jgi:hypothetical protein
MMDRGMQKVLLAMSYVQPQQVKDMDCVHAMLEENCDMHSGYSRSRSTCSKCVL